LRFEQFAIFTNVRRIDPVGFVATQLGAGEVPNLCGVDDVARLMQCARCAG
jgi:hypothetical protein